MTNWRKIIVIFALSAFSAEGKVKNNEKTVPIEVVLNTKSNGKETVIPESSLIKNKAIELKIRSNEDEEGKVDLIIAATKEVQATERKIDRYSPAFNAEHSFLNNETPRDSNIMPPLGRNWDTSRQESPTFSSNGADLFPFLMLRQVLQTPQPLLLEQNQFSPLQNLRYFEDNLQRQLIPHTNQGMGNVNGIPMGVVVSQPIFTSGDSRNVLDQQRLLNSPQVLNLLQLLPQNNQNIPSHISEQLPLHNPPLNRYSIINGTPLNLHSPQNHNFLQNNAITGNFNGPAQQYSEHRNIQPSLRQQPFVSQSIPDILGPNKRPLPFHKRPEYTLGRNLQNTNIDQPLHKNTHPQTILPQQRDIHQNLPKLSDNRIRTYQQNNDFPQASPYQTTVIDKPNQHLYAQQHHTLSPIQSNLRDSVPNGRSNLLHQQNIRNADHSPIHTYKERYRPPLREYNSDSPNQPGLHGSGHPLILNQQSLSNNYQNPVFRNSPSSNIPEDHRKIPHHPHSSESERVSPFRQQSSDSMYPPRHSIDNGQQSPQNHLPSVQGGYSNHQVYQEPSYLSNSRNTGRGIADSTSQSEEIPETDSERLSKYKEEYSSSLPMKRRRVRNRKKVQAKEKDDLDGHSSHQYIIKIG